MLSDPYYQTYRTSSSPLPTSPSLDTIRNAVQTYPTILFLHGTGGHRVTPSRKNFYLHASSRLQANIIAIDYRGFGDSTGIPTEDGVEIDAYTAWKWILEQGAKQEDVLVIGHSLGTNIATRLGKHLALDGSQPRGVVLLAPFSELSVLLETYPILNVPILQPVMSFAWGRSMCFSLCLICKLELICAVLRIGQGADCGTVRYARGYSG